MVYKPREIDRGRGFFFHFSLKLHEKSFDNSRRTAPKHLEQHDFRILIGTEEYLLTEEEFKNAVRHAKKESSK